MEPTEMVHEVIPVEGADVSIDACYASDVEATIQLAQSEEDFGAEGLKEEGAIAVN